MTRLVPVDRIDDILPAYRDTPLEWLLRYHNLREPLPPPTGRAELLVGMCMDDRKDLTIPEEFAFVIRAAGGNLRDRVFDVSYAVAVGGVNTIALLAHTDCGMAHLREKRDAFVRGLVTRGGWSEEAAATLFDDSVGRYEIGDPVSFVLTQTAELRQRFPGLRIAPFLYRVEDDRLTQIVDA